MIMKIRVAATYIILIALVFVLGTKWTGYEELDRKMKVMDGAVNNE